MSILVLGGCMVDYSLLKISQTYHKQVSVTDGTSVYLGGKGFNQAIALSRSGKKTILSGKLGSDVYSNEFLELLDNENINRQFMFIEDGILTSRCFKINENNKEKYIVDDKTNYLYSDDNLEILFKQINLNKIDFTLIQLELDYIVINNAIRKLKKEKIPILIDPGPALKYNHSLIDFHGVDFITPNINELSRITGRTIRTKSDVYSAGEQLLSKGIKNIIVTLGESGLIFINDTKKFHIPSYIVNSVDTRAAGDTLNGYFISMISKGWSIYDALNYASGASAITVSKVGGAQSIPTKNEVELFLKEYST